MSEPLQPSHIAVSVAQLKSSALKVVNERSNLPHTLFWSLFRAELDQIKRKKAKERIIQQIVFDIDFA